LPLADSTSQLPPRQHQVSFRLNAWKVEFEKTGPGNDRVVEGPWRWTTRGEAEYPGPTSTFALWRTRAPEDAPKETNGASCLCGRLISPKKRELMLDLDDQAMPRAVCSESLMTRSFGTRAGCGDPSSACISVGELWVCGQACQTSDDNGLLGRGRASTRTLLQWQGIIQEESIFPSDSTMKYLVP